MAKDIVKDILYGPRTMGSFPKAETQNAPNMARRKKLAKRLARLKRKSKFQMMNARAMEAIGR